MRDKTTPLRAVFHRNWVQMNNANEHWWKVDHDTTKFPLYTRGGQDLVPAGDRRLLRRGRVHERRVQGSVPEHRPFINKDNAGVYGIASTGTTLTKVNLDATQRPGFMTRAGFLSSYSHSTTRRRSFAARSSPIT